jgi:hypothetical protein
MTIKCKRIACWITNATNTNSGYVILINFSTATMVARARLDVTLSTLPVLCGVLMITINHRHKQHEAGASFSGTTLI